MGKKYFDKRRCYVCGESAEGREHIPPKQFFKGCDFNLPTVPSCKLHNNEKSEIDIDIITMMRMPLRDMKFIRGNDILSKHADIGIRNEEYRKRTLKYDNLSDLHPIFKKKVGYYNKLQRSSNWFVWICYGLLYLLTDSRIDEIDNDSIFFYSPDTTPKNFDRNNLNSLIDFFVVNDYIRQQFSKVNWEAGWIEYPREIFEFRYYREEENLILFWLHFYNNYNYYIGLKFNDDCLLQNLSSRM